MHYTSLLAAALYAASSLAIPPEDFGFPSAPNDTALTVTFPNGGNATSLSEAELFGIGVPAEMPSISVDTAKYESLADYTGSYIVFMVDPDASYPQNPSQRFVFHWGQPNMTASNISDARSTTGRVLTNSSAPWVPYRRPGPPTDSDAHRYILYAFHQPQNFSIPPAFAGFSAQNRSSFNLTEFARVTSLGDPAAANYFYCVNKTGVPADFIAEAGGTYPGGNGLAVTNGPGPMASTTSSAPASSASASPSSTVTGVAARIDVSTATSVILGALSAWLVCAF